MTFPLCQCGGELTPPPCLTFAGYDYEPTPENPHQRVATWVQAPAVTPEEEEAANATEDAAIVCCRVCGARLVLHSSDRPDRYRKRTTPDQSVFNVTP